MTQTYWGIDCVLEQWSPLSPLPLCKGLWAIEMVPCALFYFHDFHEGTGKSVSSVQLDGLCYLRCLKRYTYRASPSKEWKVFTNNLCHIYLSYLCGLWYTKPFTKRLASWIVFSDASERNHHTSYFREKCSVPRFFSMLSACTQEGREDLTEV